MKLSIQWKMLIGFSLLFLTAFLILNYFVSGKIESNNEKAISQELASVKENCNIFVRQALVDNQYNNNSTDFERMSGNLPESLSAAFNCDIGIYSLSGKLLGSTDPQDFGAADLDDLKNAVRGQSSYTIVYAGEQVKVYFSYPVVIENNKLGILRMIRDYSALYGQGRDITNFIYMITVVIFAAVFVFSFLLSRNITLPLSRLARFTNEVARGNMDVPALRGRKDEIGELYSNFSWMVKQIKHQINTIERDRDELKQLIEHKKNFYDNVTHELKTPLTSILGYAQMIRENGFHDPEFFDKATEHIVKESQRLHAMVLALLELSGQIGGIDEKYENTDIGKLLSETCEGMAFRAQRYGNTINVQAEKGLAVNGSRNKLKQVFINIIDNAIKYGLPNEEIKAAAFAAGGFINITIQNKGVGIPEDELGQIFEPFYRADKRRSREMGSCGLGLCICKEIIEKHNGEITVQSVPNQTTTVYIKLPALKTETGENLYEE